MSSIDIIENKISALQKYLKILEQYSKYSLAKIKSDITLKGAVERYLYLAVQATIELAEAVIAFKKLRKPTTYGETFDILHEENLISADLTKKLIGMVGFRNIIAHDYEKINFEIVHDVLQNRLTDIKKFIGKIRPEIGI